MALKSVLGVDPNNAQFRNATTFNGAKSYAGGPGSRPGYSPLQRAESTRRRKNRRFPVPLHSPA